MTIIQIVDISSSIIHEFDKQRAHNEVLNVINACVSHELRNPLNSIQAQNFLKKELYSKLRAIKVKDQQIQKAIDEILDQLENGQNIQEASSELMSSMIQDFLDYSQIKAGKFRKNITRFNIRKSIEKVVSIQKLKADSKGLSMPIVFENIAESQEAYHRNFLVDGKYSPIISSDESRIMQVLLGLQSNALKFTAKGHVKIIVRIVDDLVGLDGDQFVKISVEDTGIGISQQNQKKLFKLFGFVQDSNQMNTQGIGLGLVIAE